MLRNGQVNTFGGTIYFAVDDTTQETSMEQTKPDSENPELHNPFLSQANGISFAEKFEFILTSLLQISNRTTFFQYRSMSDGRFLVSLTEVSTSEKKLVCQSLLKVGDNYWMQEEPEHTGEGDYVDAFVQKLELDESAIMVASLCDNSKFVAFITKKFQIENYMPIMLYSDDLP